MADPIEAEAGSVVLPVGPAAARFVTRLWRVFGHACVIGPDGDKPVDGVAQFCAGAVQEDAAMTGREAEDGGDLVGVAAFEVAQDDDGALRRRQGLEGLRDVPPELPPADDALRVEGVPERDRLGPVAVGDEAVGIVGRAAGLLPREVAEGTQAAVLNGAAAGAVEHDAGHPGRQRGAARKAVEAGDDRKPGVLHHLLRGRALAHDGLRESDERGVVPPEERAEGGLVAGAQPREQRVRARRSGWGGGADGWHGDRLVRIRRRVHGDPPTFPAPLLVNPA